MINVLYLHVGAELYGADVILLEILKNLDKTKYKPYVVLPCSGPLYHEIKKLSIEVHISSYPILRRKHFNIKGIFTYIKDMNRTIEYLIDFCKDKEVHLVHTNTSAVLQGAMLHRKLKIKHIWHLHEMLDKPKLVFKLLAKIISKNCDKVLTVSNAVKNHWMKSGYFEDDKIRVIHNGIDLTKFNPHNDTKALKEEFNIEEGEKVVSVIGRVNAIKGQEVFLKSMEKVIAKQPKAKALIVGGVYEGQEWRVKKLRKLIAKSPVKDKIIFTDFRNDSPNIHCLTDVFVLSSISYDSFPTVVLEAMASKKPVVSFKSGGVVEMVDHGVNGYFAKFGDVDDLAAKIECILENDKLATSFGEAGYKIVHDNFTSKTYVVKIEKFYDEIIYGRMDD